MSELRTLGDVCTQIIDCEHKTAPAAPDGMGFAYSIGTPNIRDGRMLLEAAKSVDEATYRTWTARGEPQVGDIIFTREAPVGEAAFVDGSQRVCLGQRTVLLRPDMKQVVPRYLHFLLLTPRLQHLMNSKAEGSTVPHLNVSEIRALPLADLPSIPDQQAVASLLAALDNKMAVNDRIVKNSYELVQALWTNWATGASNFMAVSRLAEVVKGLSYKGSGLGGSVPLINLGNFSVDGQFKSSALKYYDGESKDRHWVNRGDLLMANTDLTQRREILGQPALALTDTEKALFTHHVFAIRPHAGVEDDLLWLYGAFRDPIFRERAITYATGTTVVALPRDAVLTYEVPWPEQEIRRDWSEKAQGLIDSAAARSGENWMLSQLRDALLPGLMSGAIRVRDAEKALEDET